MFDFAWSEIGLIAAVALILIGPKDLPVAIRTITDMIKKARRMASEFQTHVDEMMREADLHEVRQSINEIRNFDFKGEFERTVDPDRSIRDTFASNPLHPDPIAPAASTVVASETIHLPASTTAPLPAEPESLPTWFVPTADALAPGDAPIVVQHLGPRTTPAASPAPPFVPPTGANA
jgi:sec-independent protein translocase protein TatB